MGIVALKTLVSWQWDRSLVFFTFFFFHFLSGKQKYSKRAFHKFWKLGRQHHREICKIYLFFCCVPACKMKRTRNSLPSYSLPGLTTLLWFVILYMYKVTKHTVRSQWKHVVSPEKSLACVMGTSHAPQTNHKKKTVYFFSKLISQCVIWLLSLQSSRTDILSCVSCVLCQTH